MMRGAKQRRFAKRKWLWLLAVGMAVYLTVDYALIGGWFVRVPGQQDSRLLGRWHGKAKNRVEGFRFLANGSGEFYSPWNESTRQFAWGIEGGKLVAKVMMTDYYGLARYTYSLSEDGNRLRLDPTERRYGAYFPPTLDRTPIEASK